MNLTRNPLSIWVVLLVFNLSALAHAEAISKDCLSCHDKTIITESRKIPNIKEKLALPFSAHNSLECIDCHISHDDIKNPNLLIDSFPFEKHTAYISTAHGTTHASCSTCHNKKSELNKNFSLEIKAIDISNTVGNTYALCFRCHHESILDKNISGNETNFYNESESRSVLVRTNLHWSHVTQAKVDGNPSTAYSCAVCHDVHGSNQARNVRLEALANHTNLRFKISNNGGSCAGACHQNAKYLRIK